MTQSPVRMTDVVEEFPYESQNARYNDAYRHWRRTSKCPYAFRFVKDHRASVFVEGSGFVKETLHDSAHAKLYRIGKMLGLLLILFLLFDAVVGGMITWALNRFFHMDVTLSVLSIHGSQWAMVLVKVLVESLKYMAVLLTTRRLFRLPSAIISPCRFGPVPDWLCATSLALLCGLLISICSWGFGGSYLSLSPQLLYTYEDTGAILTYALLDILVLSLLSEFFLRGMLLPVLRQFGDVFALAAIAGISFLMPNDLPYRLGDMLIGLLCGYYMLRTGSILTCYLIRIAYGIVLFSQLILNGSEMPLLNNLQLRLLILTAAVVGLAVGILLGRKSAKRFCPCRLKEQMPWHEKYFALISTPTMLLWCAIVTILTLIQSLT